ncbi:histidine phosphatase family protein [Polaromonas sp.]|nr:histidine phosphatase family protein [Polaromonas sp.]
MELIFWRHAQAHKLSPGGLTASADLARTLTPRGKKQADRMGRWLDRQLPGNTRIWVSPARRCEQTALALGRKFEMSEALAPDASYAQLLALVQWPESKVPILVVGHQPTLGQTIAQLLGLTQDECAVQKGALWWLKTSDCDISSWPVVVARAAVS